MTREDHLMLCKSRAIAILWQGRREDAVASMVGDMNSREDTKVNPILIQLAMRHILDCDNKAIERWIMGFR